MERPTGPTLLLEADALDADGSGLASHEGRSVSVPGLLPGERARVRLVHRGRNQSHGELVALELERAGRRKPPCLHQRDCNGCPLMHAEPELQRELKRERLRTRYGLEVDAFVPAPAELGYRFAAKRVVGGTRGAVVLGSYRRRSHILARMDGCLVDHPDLAAAARDIAAVASAQDIEPYDEARRAGDLRYVWLKTDGQGAVMVTLVTACAPSAAAERLPALLTRATSVAWSVQADVGDALRGSPPRILRGPPELALELCGERVVAGPLGFLQPNPAVAARAYTDLLSSPDGAEITGDLALDLYAGTGVTTRLLARRFREVRPCESYPESAALLGVAPQAAAPFLGSLDAQTKGRVALVIANPPRAGLGPEVCDALLTLAAPRLHIMSCNPASLARDLAQLAGPSGRYRVSAVRAYDTLPQTPELELVAWLERVEAG